KTGECISRPEPEQTELTGYKERRSENANTGRCHGQTLFADREPGFSFRDDLFFEPFRHADFFEDCDQFALQLAMLLEPCCQLWILPGQIERFLHRLIVRVVKTGAIQQQHFLCFFSGHGHSFPAGAELAASSLCSCAIPRAIRDLTVPMGMPRTSAICL